MHRFAPEFVTRLGRAPQRVVVPWRNPAQAYGDFLAAVAKHDVDAVVARMTDAYARHLNHHRARGEFQRDFEQWCDKYPRELRVVGWRVDDDTATVKTRDVDGMLQCCVTMELHEGMWCVGAERWHNHDVPMRERSHV